MVYLYNIIYHFEVINYYFKLKILKTTKNILIKYTYIILFIFTHLFNILLLLLNVSKLRLILDINRYRCKIIT